VILDDAYIREECNVLKAIVGALLGCGVLVNYDATPEY